MSVRRNEKATPGEPLIQLQNVSKRFAMQRERQRSFQEIFIKLLRRQQHQGDLFWPLKNLSLTINQGDCVGVIGPNGSGKSTLLKLITGILTPDEGEMLVNGRISSLLELGAGFHPDLTGRENIYLNGSIYGLSRAEMNKRLDSIIEYAELGDFIDTPIKHYSSGMYVRLGFAVAIHTNPDLLLVDEVLAVGDATFQRKCLKSIQQFRDNGGTLFLVSHDLGSIQSICKRVIWLEHGQMQADGHPTDVVMDYISHLAREEEAKAQKAQGAGSKAQGADGGAAAKPRRWGTGKLRITKVDFCDADGQPRTNFRNGDPLTIRLHYEAAERINAPIFGLAIYHQNGTHITGPNTKFGQLPLAGVEGVGIISYQIPTLTLLEGSYAVSVAVINTTDTETYDYHDRLHNFQVYRGKSKEQYGLVTLNGVWE
ncbi:MAG: ABC transporter ATP-binding protein [Caldilineaceae bacterium]